MDKIGRGGRVHVRYLVEDGKPVKMVFDHYGDWTTSGVVHAKQTWWRKKYRTIRSEG